jgi:asparagine synthase (glutamine-hydrolysing)
MGGLAGVVGSPADTAQIELTFNRMLSSLQASAAIKPSGRLLPGAALGRASLEILSPGAQPTSDDAQQLWLLLEGEILDLPASAPDRGHRGRLSGAALASALLERYRSCGERFVRDLNGSFNLALWDARHEKLIVANDRFGTRPLYYAHASRVGFCFASEIKALLQVPGIRRDVNREATVEFLTLRHLLGDKTPINGIAWLPPATILTYQFGRLSLDTYWAPPFEQEDRRLTLSSSAAQLLELLRQAVGRCLKRDRATAILLSGGLDSRLLVSVAAGRWPLTTITRGVPGCDDAKLAKRVSAELGTAHHFLEIAPDFLMRCARPGVWFTDGLMTAVDFYELSTLDQLSQYCDVVCFGLPAGPLGGLGLSPTFAGLSDSDLAHSIYAQRANLVDDEMQPKLLTESFYREAKDVVRDNLLRVLSGFPPMPSQFKAQHYFFRQYGPRSALYGPVLTRSQVETCFPYADADLLDFTCRVPAALRSGRRVQIEMLLQAAPSLAHIPWQFSGLAVSASTPGRVRLQRAFYRLRREISGLTKGLIPLPPGREQVNWAHWFRTVLRGWLEGLLLSDRTLERGYFRPEGVRHLIQAHMSGARDHSRQFGLLLTVELWHRLFIEGELP